MHLFDVVFRQLSEWLKKKCLRYLLCLQVIEK